MTNEEYMIKQFKSLEKVVFPYKELENFQKEYNKIPQSVFNSLSYKIAQISQNYKSIIDSTILSVHAVNRSWIDINKLISSNIYSLSESVVHNIAQINLAIANSQIIYEYEYDDNNNLNENDEIEQRLIDNIPEDDYKELKRVNFLPITLLNEINKNPEAMYNLSSRDFEIFIAEIINKLGFKDVVLTPQSGDKGRDIIATKIVHDIPILFAFECKKYSPDRPIGPNIVRSLLGVISHNQTKAAKGVLVTSSFFTAGAKKLIISEPLLDGKDFNGIVEWLNEVKL